MAKDTKREVEEKQREGEPGSIEAEEDTKQVDGK